MKINKLLIIFLFIFSIIPRLYNITNYPPSPNWDEVSLGYNSYSILKTGRDEWGKILPTIFRAYGDYKLPVYIYFSTVPIFIFGLNPLSTKLISILSGSIAPIFIYLILKKLFKKNSIAFMGALLYSLSPWTIFLSRIALEANLFLTLFIASIYFLISKKFSLSLVFYSLSLFTYNSSRVLLPFYLILLFYFYRNYKIDLKKHKIGVFIFTLALLLFLFQSLDTSGQARYKWVSIIDEGAINQINQLRQIYPRLLANKVSYFIYKASLNYLSHFNPSFLFKNGGSHYQFNIPNFYLFSPLLAPFLIFGFYKLLKNKKYLPIFLLLVAPLPSAITRDAPHTLRSAVFVSLSSFISIYGLLYLFKNHLKKLSLLSFVLIIFTQIQFWPNYKQYSLNYSSSWQYGYKDLVEFIKDNYQKYNKFYITKKYGEPHQFLLFYWPIDPKTYQQGPNKVWRYQSDWYWIDAFDKFVFLNDWQIKDQQFSQNSLLITSPNNYPTQNSKLLKSIYYPIKDPVFDIIYYD